MPETMSGGCHCGRVRFRVTAAGGDAAAEAVEYARIHNCSKLVVGRMRGASLTCASSTSKTGQSLV